MVATDNSPSRACWRALAVLVLGIGLMAVVAISSAPDSADARPAKLLGKTKKVPKASCPKTPCEAVGRVTGFQRKADGRRGRFKAKSSGSIVAWEIQVSRPNGTQSDFFGNFYESTDFGTNPTARISILRRVEGKKYSLRAQSPVVDLSSALNSRQIYTLSDPLRINKGEVLALTIPTWAPAFAVGLGSRKNVWRASRSKSKCEGADDIRESRPHQEVGSDRNYGCEYRTARLLYWGYFVPR